MINLFRGKDNNQNQDAAKTRVLELMDAAHVQRAKIHLVFDDEVTSLHNLSCSLLSFDADRLTLEIASLKEAVARWIGQTMTCYFNIASKKSKADIFYTFRSVVLDTSKSGHKTVVIQVQTPDFIGQDQRRKSLRIAPELANFTTLAFWPYTAAGGFDPDAPKLALPDFKTAQARLVNISAGGMKLLVKSSKLRDLTGGFQIGNRLIIYVDFNEIPGSTVDECWLIAKAANAYEDFASKEYHIGLEFIAQGKIDSQTGKVVWKKVVDKVIEEIATWTHHWHLEMYRNKGLGPI